MRDKKLTRVNYNKRNTRVKSRDEQNSKNKRKDKIVAHGNTSVFGNDIGVEIYYPDNPRNLLDLGIRIKF